MMFVDAGVTHTDVRTPTSVDGHAGRARWQLTKLAEASQPGCSGSFSSVCYIEIILYGDFSLPEAVFRYDVPFFRYDLLQLVISKERYS